ncbi:GNAT family N-acetyltransferase [Spirosoma luteum]|uniref:GNAT family N-acetyltransferase n=1 Tax=Spirosoma luteum TaxID=431553 RepID=UPI00035FF6D2|nr:GNAT family N-acetyltransferase [Spirosoma luteum]
MNTTPVKNNAHRHRFELDTEGKLSIVNYQTVDDETLALVHTEVDESLEGQGVGSHLVEGVLQYVEQNNLKIVAACPFISTYIKRHPDWNRVVSTAYTSTGF